MQLKIRQRKIYFHKITLNYIKINLIYAHEKHHAPTI